MSKMGTETIRKNWILDIQHVEWGHNAQLKLAFWFLYLTFI